MRASFVPVCHAGPVALEEFSNTRPFVPSKFAIVMIPVAEEPALRFVVRSILKAPLAERSISTRNVGVEVEMPMFPLVTVKSWFAPEEIVTGAVEGATPAPFRAFAVIGPATSRPNPAVTDDFPIATFPFESTRRAVEEAYVDEVVATENTGI